MIAALQDAGLSIEPRVLGDCRTAVDAAASVGCHLDQIAKSIIFGANDGCALFLTAGGHQVDIARATALAGTDLERADASVVRAVTGFAIGGVSPIGHLNPSPVWMDRRLMEFDIVWAAAGTPRHVFPIDPKVLLHITGGTLADFI